jgi:formylglycine-generating enzyme required for sulfatase activity
MENKVNQHRVKNIDFNTIKCPKGEFWMGEDISSSFWATIFRKYLFEKGNFPKHKVKINRSFLIGETNVTQDLWQSVMEWQPSVYDKSRKLPVDSVTWYDCLIFCNELSNLEKLTPCFSFSDIKKCRKNLHVINAKVKWNKSANGYRLPTEAEWEYAAKADTLFIYSGSNNLKEVACIDEYKTPSVSELFLGREIEKQEVKTKKPNDWGIYDMSGNVWEWCMDKWKPNAYQHRNPVNGVIDDPIEWQDEAYSRIFRPHCCVLRGGASSSEHYNYEVTRRHYGIARHTVTRTNIQPPISPYHDYDADIPVERIGFRVVRFVD